MRRILVALLLVCPALAQDSRPGPTLTAVHTLADHHTIRWTSERDPLVKIAGVCRITPGQSAYTLACTGPPVSEPRSGRRYLYSIVLFRDLEQNHYLAACSETSRNTPCDDLKAGQTFSAEVEDRTLRIVIHGEQLPLRILEFRPHVPTDSLTRGTPSQVRPAPGAPSDVSWSKASVTRGSPSDARPSQVSVSDGAPSAAQPSEASTAVASSTSARLHVYCPIGSAQVYVDGQLIGHPPVDVPVAPGRHSVLVRVVGRPDWFRRVEVVGGKITRVAADLRR